MIYTFTLNPALDYYMIVHNPLIPDEVNRSSEESLKAGGKGLNVSRVLSEIKVHSTAIALCGGFSGNYIVDCFKHNPYIQMKNIEMDGVTRINVKIHGDDYAICVNGNGPVVTEQVKQQIMDVLTNITSEDYVMICGSKAKGMDDEFILQMCDAVNEAHAKLVVDMESLNFDLLKRMKPFLIKPNLYEFGLMCGKEDMSVQEVHEYLPQVLDTGLQNMIISLGKDGALFVGKNDWIKLSQKPIQAINKVGCGDSLLACFIGKLSIGEDKTTALKYGLAAGMAQASKMEDITLADIEEYLDYVE